MYAATEFFQKYFSATSRGFVRKYSFATAKTFSTGATPSLFGQSLPKRMRSSSAAVLQRGDAFLLGADLVKPERDLLIAYDDPLGVSAAFNLNVLLRINRELGGNFDLRGFRHRAAWNAALSRMEMFAVSTRRQHVRIEALGLQLDLEEREPIWTESSYK